MDGRDELFCLPVIISWFGSGSSSRSSFGFDCIEIPFYIFSTPIISKKEQEISDVLSTNTNKHRVLTHRGHFHSRYHLQNLGYPPLATSAVFFQLVQSRFAFFWRLWWIDVWIDLLQLVADSIVNEEKERREEKGKVRTISKRVSPMNGCVSHYLFWFFVQTETHKFFEGFREVSF